MKDDRKNIKLPKETLNKFKELKMNKHESYISLIERLHKKEFCKKNPNLKKCESEVNQYE